MDKNLTLSLDREAFNNIEELKKAFRVNSASAAIRKAIAVANFATQQAASSDGVIVMRGDKEDVSKSIRVLLR
ncbi:MAG: hypothetical protein KGJ57_16400 [Sphingomonadales bacterium]|nr:hypothetical protein [Sphingomonadales bacterium]MDE2170981.1 hypothetical protein [Sphingomonadales bacterium]